jgi:hypothetical protein
VIEKESDWDWELYGMTSILPIQDGFVVQRIEGWCRCLFGSVLYMLKPWEVCHQTVKGHPQAIMYLTEFWDTIFTIPQFWERRQPIFTVTGTSVLIPLSHTSDLRYHINPTAVLRYHFCCISQFWNTSFLRSEIALSIPLFWETILTSVLRWPALKELHHP